MNYTDRDYKYRSELLNSREKTYSNSNTPNENYNNYFGNQYVNQQQTSQYMNQYWKQNASQQTSQYWNQYWNQNANQQRVGTNGFNNNQFNQNVLNQNVANRNNQLNDKSGTNQINAHIENMNKIMSDLFAKMKRIEYLNNNSLNEIFERLKEESEKYNSKLDEWFDDDYKRDLDQFIQRDKLFSKSIDNYKNSSFVIVIKDDVNEND